MLQGKLEHGIRFAILLACIRPSIAGSPRRSKFQGSSSLNVASDSSSALGSTRGMQSVSNHRNRLQVFASAHAERYKVHSSSIDLLLGPDLNVVFPLPRIVPLKPPSEPQLESNQTATSQAPK